MTPDLPKAQEFFRAARDDVARACGEGRLKCRPSGKGLLPPFELRWTRAYIQELFALLAMTAAAHPRWTEVHPERYEVDANFGRMFQFVTMTHDFDTQVHATGVTAAVPRYESSLASWRSIISGIYRVLAPGLVLLTVAAFAVRVALWRRIAPSALSLTAAIFMGYTLLRIAALSYVAVFLGHFDYRLVYSTHSFILLIGLFVMADAVTAARAAKDRGIGNG